MFLLKWLVRLVALAAAFCFSVSLGSCVLFSSLDTDALRDQYSSALETAGKLVLTGDSRLVGERVFGADCFTGAYTADYLGFSGTEFLFGGVAFERGGRIAVRCTLEARDGAAQLYWLCGAEQPRLLLEGSGSCDTTLELPGDGSCYLVLQGEALAARVSITLEETEALSESLD